MISKSEGQGDYRGTPELLQGLNKPDKLKAEKHR
jgi:hypothetical protein